MTTVTRTSTIIIGAGQAGLAMSRCLSELGIEHVVFERGKVAQRWRSHSWDSLHLLTPNWMTRLPGFQYDGDDPDGFMSVPDLIGLLDRYAVSSRAPIVSDTSVMRLVQTDDRFRVITDRGAWSADSVVIATGYCDLPAVPAASLGLSTSITQLAPANYRRPAQLPPGGVLIVGASATGVQLADEIQQSGRQVTLAVGRHLRLPRHYRGRDILWWLDRLGVLEKPAEAVHSIEVSRNQPSLQLVGRPDHSSLDVGTLRERGVRLVGRVRGISGNDVSLADDLIASTAAADIKMAEILTRIDRHIDSTGLPAEDPEPFRSTWPRTDGTPERLDLKSEGIQTVIWATGCRRAYPWLQIPVLDRHGEIVHNGGFTPAFGLYVLGMNFQRRRNSSFIDGVGGDAWKIAEQISTSITGVRVA
jgi:putative flavoprotein involved in K+ transport